jgi:hypothetical protein
MNDIEVSRPEQETADVDLDLIDLGTASEETKGGWIGSTFDGGSGFRKP